MVTVASRKAQTGFRLDQPRNAAHGFVAYYALRDGANVTSVTVCNDKAGTEESTRRAAAWVKENVKATIGAPQISSGNVFMSFLK